MGDTKSTYSPQDAWNTLLQPFYIISTVIGILIGICILGLAIYSCARRRAARRRFVRAVDGGWAVPIFNVSNANIAAQNGNGPKPIMRESVLNLNGGDHVAGGLWVKALPLSMTLLPVPTSQPRDLLLYLLRSPSILTSDLFSRLRAIQFVRSSQTHYHHRFLAHSGNHRTPEQQPAARRTSIASTSSHPKSKERPSEITATEPVHVMFVIAMPASPPPLHPRISSATAHEPAIPTANQELCIGVVSASLQVPVQYLKDPREEQAVAIRHGNMQEAMDEVEEVSTIHSRWMRSEDPGHGYARSPASSRHRYVGNYGDEESSYMPHRSASASPSYWEDHGGATGGGDGSIHDAHNSYLAPPSFHYRPSAQGHGRDDFSSIEIQQRQYRHDQARSGDSSGYPPSRAYTPSLVSANVPPPPGPSVPPASSTSQPLPTQPRVQINDTEPSSAAAGDIASQQSHGSEVEQSVPAAHRTSQFTSTTDTTASATDVEGGYDADADAGRRLSLRPRGAARRRAGS